MSPEEQREVGRLFLAIRAGLSNCKSLIEAAPSERPPVERAEDAHQWAIERLRLRNCIVRADGRGGFVVAAPGPGAMRIRARTATNLVRVADALCAEIERKGTAA